MTTIACRAQHSQQVRQELSRLIKPCQGEMSSDRIARHEWENRFKLMIVKPQGPSLVPAEAIVPLENLGAVMVEIANKVHQPVVKEGVIIRQGAKGKPEVVVFGFIPADQCRFSYKFVFGLVMTIVLGLYEVGVSRFRRTK